MPRKYSGGLSISPKRQITTAIAVAALLAVLAAGQFAVTGPPHTALAATVQSVSSLGQEQEPILTEVALNSNTHQVFQVTGAQIVLRDVGGAYKNYIYLFVNPGQTFGVNTTGLVQNQTLTGQNTNNIYWNAQTPLSSGGGTVGYGTVGQDLDPANNTLSLWQWANPNYVFGGRITTIPQTGSYDGGGPSFCSTYSNGQERHSVYMMIVNSASNKVYTMSGAELLEQSNGGVTSTTLVVFVNSTPSGGVGPATQTCPQVANPRDTPYLRWFVRSPPTNTGIAGNFAVIGTVGAQLGVATNTHAIKLLQFINRAWETGYMPPAFCTTCVVPSSGASGTSTSTTTTTTSSAVSFSVSFVISPLSKTNTGKYYNIQTVTVTSASGQPISGASVTLFENCGCAGGYAHGTTNTQGQFADKDVYPSAGTYNEWASVTYNGVTVTSLKIPVVVP